MGDRDLVFKSGDGDSCGRVYHVHIHGAPPGAVGPGLNVVNAEVNPPRPGEPEGTRMAPDGQGRFKLVPQVSVLQYFRAYKSPIF